MTDKPTPGWTTVGKVNYVVDGDTLDVTVTRKIRVRLLNCWSPESHETANKQEKRHGLISKAHLKGLVEGKDVTLFIPMTSKDGAEQDIITMGRFLGSVYVDVPGSGGEVHSVDVAEQMRLLGLAFYTKEEEMKWLKTLPTE